MKERAKQKRVTITGVVSPYEWDSDDNVCTVSITGAGKTEYIVTTKATVKKLLKHVDEEIEATGTVKEGEFGELVFALEDFKVVGAEDDGTGEDSDEEEEEDEDWDDDFGDERDKDY